MEISVVIVSYNVRYFLEQCLFSVRKALHGIPAEVWVVDNCSTDETVSYLQPKFPEVHFIENDQNRGFSKANNQVLGSISGKFVHFLNPDTILPEDFYQISLAFMEECPRAGALGPRMLDGTGNFLPESKRGKPTLWSSFCKMSGLWRHFPQKKLFSGYYRGDLPENEQNPVEILSGASMFIRKTVIEKIGGFDERYFMYGEDIDLSYAILLLGFENWYIPQATIVHFKGESTQKNSTYWEHFYGAMLLFIEKHAKGPFKEIEKWFLSRIIQKMLQIAQKSSKNRQKDSNLIKNDQKERMLLEECEERSFKQIIQQMNDDRDAVQYMIRSKASGSMVGSDHAEHRGQAVSINMR